MIIIYIFSRLGTKYYAMKSTVTDRMSDLMQTGSATFVGDHQDISTVKRDARNLISTCVRLVDSSYHC